MGPERLEAVACDAPVGPACPEHSGNAVQPLARSIRKALLPIVLISLPVGTDITQGSICPGREPIHAREHHRRRDGMDYKKKKKTRVGMACQTMPRRPFVSAYQVVAAASYLASSGTFIFWLWPYLLVLFRGLCHAALEGGRQRHNRRRFRRPDENVVGTICRMSTVARNNTASSADRRIRQGFVSSRSQAMAPVWIQQAAVSASVHPTDSRQQTVRIVPYTAPDTSRRTWRRWSSLYRARIRFESYCESLRRPWQCGDASRTRRARIIDAGSEDTPVTTSFDVWSAATNCETCRPNRLGDQTPGRQVA
jgi:hypothetical protein